MDRTNRSFQPVSMAGGGQGGEPVRYNLKKRLVSRKPTLNKQQLLLSRLEPLTYKQVWQA